MKELSKVQFVFFTIGGILMVIGAGCMAFGFMIPKLVGITAWLFLLGTVLFSVIQATQVYEGKDLTIRRLKNIQYFADLCFVLSGISMVDTVHGLFAGLFSDRITYITYVYNKWVIFLFIAAVLEVYTVHRISHELKKQDESQDESSKL